MVFLCRQCKMPREMIKLSLRIIGKGCFLVLGLAIAVASCSASQESSDSFESVDGFVDVLKNAGAVVRSGERNDQPTMKVVGQEIYVDDEPIEVYEYTTIEARQELSSTISIEDGTIAGSTSLWPDNPTIWAVGHLIVVYDGHHGGTILLISGLLGDPLTYASPERDEPYPPAIVEAIGFLADQLSLDPGTIQVLDFIEVEWPDACLGAAQPDEVCAQVLTAGWSITLSVDDFLYELRTDDIGTQIRMP